MFQCQLQSLSSGCIGQKDDAAQCKGHAAVVNVGYGASCHPMGRVFDPATTGRWLYPPYLLTLKMVATLFPKQKNITSKLNHKGGHHVCIYLNINQLDALNFIMSLFHASTCFEHKCSSSGGQNCTIQHLVSSHL